MNYGYVAGLALLHLHSINFTCAWLHSRATCLFGQACALWIGDCVLGGVLSSLRSGKSAIIYAYDLLSFVAVLLKWSCSLSAVAEATVCASSLPLALGVRLQCAARWRAPLAGHPKGRLPTASSPGAVAVAPFLTAIAASWIWSD